MHNLDKKDIAIIRELDFDARISISSLARKVRISKEVANYRLKKLIDDGVIKGFNAIIDPYKFGYQLYSLRIKFKHVPESRKKEMMDWTRSQDNAARIVTLGGKWDLSLYFWAKNPSDFNKTYDFITSKYGHIMLKKSLSVTIDMESRPYNFLYDKPSTEFLSIGNVGECQFDSKDKQILDILSKNCRMPLIEIAKKTKLTANAVKYRMKKLEDEKIINGYSTTLNSKFFGFCHFRVTLYLSDSSKKKEAKEFLRQQKDVILITNLLGLGDIRFEILCPSIMRVYALVDELNQIMPDMVRDFDDLIILDEEIIDYYPNH